MSHDTKLLRRHNSPLWQKNKGLALDVVPKFVEGFTATYITGSGQTRQTADRVKIYEREGNVQPAKRYKWKAKGPVEPKRVYKKRDVRKVHAMSAHSTKHSRSTLHGVATDVMVGGASSEGGGEGLHEHIEERDHLDLLVSLASSPAVPPVPFSRRESSFGQTAAAVHFDHCLDPTPLWRNMSLFSENTASADIAIGAPSMCSSASTDSAVWSTVDSEHHNDDLDDFQPSDPQLIFCPHFYEERCR